MSTVVLICVDGLDPEYLENCDAPNLQEIGRKGFFNLGQSMMPSVTNVNNINVPHPKYDYLSDQDLDSLIEYLVSLAEVKDE